jgi:hypothetical protein
LPSIAPAKHIEKHSTALKKLPDIQTIAEWHTSGVMEPAGRLQAEKQHSSRIPTERVAQIDTDDEQLRKDFA